MEGMEVLHHHVAGIDVHRKSLSVCVRHVSDARGVRQEVRTFGTMTRTRSPLVGERTRVVNRIHKVLEDANIQLGAVASDILGVSGREMIEALIQGEQDTQKMADLARRQGRGKIPQLRLALEGTVSDHHRFLLKMYLQQYDEIESWMGQLTERIEKVCVPFAPALEKIMEVPGYSRTAAENLVAEIGTDMSRFASDDHLCSWATICPGNHESAGKQTAGKTVQGNRWLKAVLCQSAWAAARMKGSYFGAQYHRLAGRRGKKRAVIAVAHSQLKVIYHLLGSDESYQDLGPDYFLRLNADRTARYHCKVLESMGYTVLPPDAKQAI